MTNFPGPQAPYGAPVPQGTPPRPQSLTYAVGLMYAGAVLALLSAVIATLTAHSLVAGMIAQMERTMPAAQRTVLPVSLMTSVFTVMMIIFGIIEALLWLWMAWKNRAGRSWARVLSTVFFGLLCVPTLSALSRVSAAQPGSLILTVVVFSVALLAVILMWRPESSRYYEAAGFQALPGATGGGYGYPPPPAHGYGSPQSAYGHVPPAPPAPATPPPPGGEAAPEPQASLEPQAPPEPQDD